MWVGLGAAVGGSGEPQQALLRQRPPAGDAAPLRGYVVPSAVWASAPPLS